MTAILSPAFTVLKVPRSLLAELERRHPGLAHYGLVLAISGLIALGLQQLDPRTLASGANVWVKPAKFFFSVALFALTAAWFMGYVHPERHRSPLLRTTVRVLMASGTFELAYITLQGARGLESHFNFSSPLYALMYALMGIGAVALTASTLPLAWEIARRPAPELQRSFVTAVVIGLVLTFLLGGSFGAYMSSQHGHAVGTAGGHFAIFGWNRLGGDLRVAHFLGIHAEQAIPFLAAVTAGASERTRWGALILGSAAYALLTVTVFVQAVMGQPLLPG